MDQGDIERVLIPAGEIRRRVRELAGEVRERLGSRELTLVGVLTGGVVFLSDLMREMPGPLRVCFLRAASYGDSTVPGALEISGDEALDLAGCDVVLVEDIVDTGHSLVEIRRCLAAREPRSITTVALLSKRARREVSVGVDLIGFEIPDEFVVGYGLDYAQRYRNLPYVGVLSPDAAGGSD